LTLSPAYDGEFKMFEHLTYATVNLTCSLGKLSGEIIFRNGQFADESEVIGRSVVTGTCAGETGLMKFSLKTVNGKDFSMTVQVDRVGSYIVDKISMAAILSRDIAADEMAKFHEDDFTMFATIRGKSNEVVGTFSISR
jgi:hypothetical protein